jgi:hypothetical protein
MLGLSNIGKVEATGGIFARPHHFEKKGDKHRGHYHRQDHVTIVGRGGVLCEIENEDPKEVWAPAIIPVPKDKKHNFTALEDNTNYFCVFVLRDKNGEITTIYDGNDDMYGECCGSCGCKEE